jgi:hypothetical protein
MLMTWSAVVLFCFVLLCSQGWFSVPPAPVVRPCCVAKNDGIHRKIAPIIEVITYKSFCTAVVGWVVRGGLYIAILGLRMAVFICSLFLHVAAGSGTNGAHMLLSANLMCQQPTHAAKTFHYFQLNYWGRNTAMGTEAHTKQRILVRVRGNRLLLGVFFGIYFG